MPLDLLVALADAIVPPSPGTGMDADLWQLKLACRQLTQPRPAVILRIGLLIDLPSVGKTERR